jgi:DNA polymerase-2
MQLDRVGASIASFDLLYLPELRRRGVVAPSVDSSRKTAPVQGGAMLEAVPGVTPNVAVFDFKSLYPSLVRTFNLDPLSLAQGATAEANDCIEAPNGARFSREPAILPDIIERFMQRREDARARGARHADQAIKIMMNAMFGVFAASACRFFDPQVANAITGFGQQTLAWTRDAFQAEGMRVVYGDTDSVFVQLDMEDSVGREAMQARASDLRELIEARVIERIRREYGVEPRLTLELEKVYDRLFLPHVRGGRGASKKRYAGWEAGRLEIVGLEAVRRDWPAVAARLQEGMLERLFSDDSYASLMPFVKQVTDDVTDGKLDAELVYVKRIRKRKLDSYTASTPPHIQAARKLQEAGHEVGRIIRYVVTRTGPEPVLPGAPLPDAIDRRHYVERVIRPVADAILVEIGHSFDEAMGQPQQLDLL